MKQHDLNNVPNSDQLLDGLNAMIQSNDTTSIQTILAVDWLNVNPVDAEMIHYSLADVEQMPFTQRYDLAVVNVASAQCDQTVLQHALVRLRDLFAKKILVVADNSITPLLRALGFSQFNPVDLGSSSVSNAVQLWQFNNLTYKRVPDWLNAKFWANPEHFDKYRW